jgi:hypothetical protein
MKSSTTQLLRQGDAKVFKKYSQSKPQMKREALQKLSRKANESQSGFDRRKYTDGFCHCFATPFATVGPILSRFGQPWCRKFWKWFKIKEASNVGA